MGQRLAGMSLGVGMVEDHGNNRFYGIDAKWVGQRFSGLFLNVKLTLFYKLT